MTKQENSKPALEELSNQKKSKEDLEESKKQESVSANTKYLEPDKVSFSDFFNFIKKLEPKGDYQKFEEAVNVVYLSSEEKEDLKGELTVLAFEILAEKHLWNPTFITDFPLSVSPLTKKHRKSKYRLVERFEPYIASMELGNAYTELNDPIDQRKRLEQQERWLKKEIPAKAENQEPESVSSSSQNHHSHLGSHSRKSGNFQDSTQSSLNEHKNSQTKSKEEKLSESSHPIDENFIHALELGMPPTGGVGLGIERLVMILTDQKSIRDCILFPALKDKS